MSTTTRKTAAAVTGIYCRISKDQQNGKGVVRQEDECRDFAKRRGWAIAGEPYIDNDISASRYTRKRRPGYRALVEEVRAGRVSRILCWKIDRLYRQPKQLEELIDMAEAGKVEIVTVMGGDIDLNTSHGRATARISVAMAAASSDDTSERLLSMKAQRRKAMLPSGGPPAFGWKDGLHQHPAEAKVLKAAYDMVLAGNSLNDIARKWTADKVRGRSNWGSGDIADALKLARHAGLLSHNGAVLGEGKWKPIVDRAKWEAAIAIIAGRSNGARVPRRRSLLTGLVTCGKCGHVMVRSSKGRGQMVIWRCNSGPGKPGCGNVSINAPKLEGLLTDTTFMYVDNIDLATLVSETAPDLSAVTKSLASLDRREEQLAASLAKGTITRRLFELTAQNIEAERKELHGRLERDSKRSALVAHAGKPGKLQREWDQLSVDQRRLIIRESLGSVTITPKRGGGVFDPKRVVIGAPRKTRRTR